MKSSRRSWARLLAGAAILIGGMAQAQQVDVGTFPQQYMNAAMNMWPVVEPFARSLFWVLASIQLAWAAIMLTLEKSDLQGWAVGLIRQIFFIGLGAAILLNAKNWMWALFNSFLRLGTSVSSEALQPGDIFGIGVQMAWTISNKEVGFDIPLGLAYLLCAGVIVLAFTLISVSLLLALIEGAIAVVLGQILLGFAGSKWTIGYTEKYIGMIVNVGMKVFVTYFMAGIAITITKNWLAIADSAKEISKIYELVGGAIILCVVVWAVPRFVSLVIGGAPSLGFSDAAGAVAGMATAVGTAAGGAMKLAHNVGGAVGGLSAGNRISGGGAPSPAGPDGKTVPPPSSPAGYSGGSAANAWWNPSPGSSSGSRPEAGANPSSEASGAASGQSGPTPEQAGATSKANAAESGASRKAGGPDVVSSAARGIAATAGLSQFVPSAVGSSDGLTTRNAGGQGVPGSGQAVPAPSSTSGLEARGSSPISGEAPGGVGQATAGISSSPPAGITASAPMSSSPGGSISALRAGAGASPSNPSPPTSNAATPSTDPGVGPADASIASASGFASAGAMTSEALSSSSSNPAIAPAPAPSSSPAPQPENLPGIKDDYERMDAANRKNKLLLNQVTPAMLPRVRPPNSPKPR